VLRVGKAVQHDDRAARSTRTPMEFDAGDDFSKRLRAVLFVAMATRNEFG
jgi:hypothetical protein